MRAFVQRVGAIIRVTRTRAIIRVTRNERVSKDVLNNEATGGPYELIRSSLKLALDGVLKTEGWAAFA